jgi:cardiolipin synthase (CMP-forming)
MYITFPTMLTLSRLAITPFIGWAIAAQSWTIAMWLLIYAAISDILDGYFARLWRQESQLGTYLDPLADKCLLATCYATLVFFPVPNLQIPFWFLLIVLIKESLLLAGAVYLGIMRQVVTIKPSAMGKLAMVVQSAFVVWLLACSVFCWTPQKTFYIFLCCALALVIGSMAQYSMAAYRKVRSGVYL